MLYFSDHRIDYFIGEDVPFIDLTTLVLGIGAPARQNTVHQQGRHHIIRHRRSAEDFFQAEYHRQ